PPAPLTLLFVTLTSWLEASAKMPWREVGLPDAPGPRRVLSLMMIPDELIRSMPGSPIVWVQLMLTPRMALPGASVRVMTDPGVPEKVPDWAIAPPEINPMTWESEMPFSSGSP